MDFFKENSGFVYHDVRKIKRYNTHTIFCALRNVHASILIYKYINTHIEREKTLQTYVYMPQGLLKKSCPKL